MKVVRLFLIATFFSVTIVAQDYSKDFKPNRNYKASATEIQAICDSYVSLSETVEASNKKVRKGVKESLGKLKDYVYSSDTADVLMYNDTLSLYVKKVVSFIKKKNSELGSVNFRPFVYRTSLPNASNLGQDVLFVNLGLICKLESEAQLAFILCHEMAHNTKNHVIDGITKRQELLQDREFKREIRRSSKQEYNRYRRLVELYKTYVATYTFNTRKNELEADSLGLIYYGRCGYDASIAVKTILKLDSIDAPVFKDSVDIKKLFAFKNVQFNNQWLETEESVELGNNLKDEKLADSLKTHPDCPVRAERLSAIIEKQKYSSGKVSFMEVPYSVIKSCAIFELIENYIQANNFSYALFYAANFQKLYPSNEYLKCAIGHCLTEINLAQKQHVFSSVVDLPDPEFSSSYNYLLKILHHLSGSDMNTVSNYYYEDNVKPCSGVYAKFVGAYAFCAKSKAPEAETCIKDFENTTKDAYLTSVLKKRFIKPKKK